jgi:hypothetical protein
MVLKTPLCGAVMGRVQRATNGSMQFCAIRRCAPATPVIAQLFADAHRVLGAGGILWVVLRTAQGAKSWARRLEESWGNCETVTIEQGYRILKSVKQ